MDCSLCMFAICSNSENFGVKQVGCKTGALEKLIERGEASIQEVKCSGVESSQYYNITRICNLYRPVEWKRSKDSVDRVKEEAKCSFGMVIDLDKNESNLITTTDSIKGICYQRDKLSAVLCASLGSIHPQILLNHHKELQDLGINCEILMYDPRSSQEDIDTDCFRAVMAKNRSTFIMKVKGGKSIDNDFFNFIEYELNEKLSKYAVYHDDENGITAISFGAVNNFYPNFLDYEVMEKEITDLSIQQYSYKKYEKKK